MRKSSRDLLYLVVVAPILFQLLVLLVVQFFPKLPEASMMVAAGSIGLYFAGLKLAIQTKESANEALTSEIRQHLDRLSVKLTIFPTSDKALQYLAGCIPDAHALWSTTLPSKGSGTVDILKTPGSEMHTEAIKKALSREPHEGTFAFVEVITPDCLARMEQYKQAVRLGNSDYHPIVTNRPDSPVINFSILHYGREKKEVVFGWVVTEFTRFQHPCFASTEPALVELFESVHTALRAQRTESASA